MSIRLIPGKQLTGELCARWDEIQRSNPTLSSPYFRPEFTQTVAAIRSDVEVAVIEGPDGIDAFFPFQRCGWGAAQPVAGRLSDFHGVIAAPGFRIDCRTLLSGCKLSSWRFDHLLTSQQDFQPFMWTMADTTYIDLANTGYKGYLANRKQHTSEIATTERKLRKLEREVGPLRLEWHSTDKQALETLLRWKSEQYLRTGLRDLFTFEWIRAFFDRLLQQDSPGLKGLFSGLYAGDRLVAAHLGMSSHHVLHWWFPSYDRELSKYSPGLGMILMILQAGADHGITRLDFGKGDEEYKFKFATGIDQVAEGTVNLRLSTHLMHRTWQATRDWVRSSPLHGPTQAPLRWVRRMRDWLRFS
jgi:CelD/BcsL family acetyltransferase involved in cellulose biosynthesis